MKRSAAQHANAAGPVAEVRRNTLCWRQPSAKAPPVPSAPNKQRCPGAWEGVHGPSSPGSAGIIEIGLTHGLVRDEGRVLHARHGQQVGGGVRPACPMHTCSPWLRAATSARGLLRAQEGGSAGLPGVPRPAPPGAALLVCTALLIFPTRPPNPFNPRPPLAKACRMCSTLTWPWSSGSSRGSSSGSGWGGVANGWCFD